MIHLDAEAGAQMLFHRTYNGTLFADWEDQPEAFRAQFRETALFVAEAAIGDFGPLSLDETEDEPLDLGEPEGGD